MIINIMLNLSMQINVILHELFSPFNRCAFMPCLKLTIFHDFLWCEPYSAIVLN
jgi:hypothetical protein